ncbi:Myb/SANT-like DNA-binding domain protein [Sesbania bispinosa]|nr:Myb/SANT-like DNA-binding domain protein [Sesbania bispinosa]
MGAGSSMGLGNINLNTTQNNNTSRSGEKRKRGEGKGNAKKGKTSNISQLGQTLNNVASAVSSHTSAVLASKEGSDIGLAMAALHTFPGVEEDQAFYARCCQVFLNPRAVQVFLAIPNPANQLAFLKNMIDSTNYP